jgi:hypothetical protein
VIRKPLWSAQLVTNGRLDSPLTNFLDALVSAANTGTDLSGVTDRLTVLEALHLYGTGGITVSGSVESGFNIHLNGADTDVLAAQIFGS